MHIRSTGVMVVLGAAAVTGAGWLVPRPLEAQPAAGRIPIPGQFPTYTAPRTADDKPNLNGIWQAFTAANWDLEAPGRRSRRSIIANLIGTNDRLAFEIRQNNGGA